jgi:flagella basal body P-ring formation protein FlgA
MDALLTPVDPGEVAETRAPALVPAPNLAAEVVAEAEIELSDYDLVSALESALVQQLGLKGRVELTPVGRLPSIKLGNEPLDIDLVETPQQLSGSGIVLRYEILRAGLPAGEWSGVFRCRHLAEVWVATRRMDAGEELSPESFATREVDLIRNAKAVIADERQLSRYELARSVYPGRPIAWTDLTPRALVRKGELVDVVVREGYLSISMKALAVGTGSLGDVVAVRNLQSKREFPAEVIDEKTVQVSL